ncbi:MAG: hypothetical protein LBE83_09865, partial [Propionibacteriaceae bacterium]|nr:hypothetical protein [Propionibacteriaceae bacterium]
PIEVVFGSNWVTVPLEAHVTCVVVYDQKEDEDKNPKQLTGGTAVAGRPALVALSLLLLASGGLALAVSLRSANARSRSRAKP